LLSLAVSSSAFAALVAGLVTASVIDVRTRRIPNELTAVMAGLGVGLSAAGASGIPLGASVAGIALGLGLMLPGYLLGATGAGDVKLMASVGAILGPGLVLSAFLFTGLAGGLLALAVAVRRRRLATTIAAAGRLIAISDAKHHVRSASSAQRFAYGPAIAIGGVLAAVLG
jgi:prepilin peptidase CpaA